MNECLSTFSALRILNDELKIIYKKNYVEKSLLHYLFLSTKIGILKHFLIANIALLFIVVFELFFTILTDKLNYFWKLALFCNFIFIVVVNFILISRETKSRFTSIYEKFQLLIDDIQNIMDSNCSGWLNVGNYPFVKIPFANSANLQWTIRDNQLINLPVALLVKGDTINLRPGQIIFADCEINPEAQQKNHYQKIYSIGQTFVSDQSDIKLENDLYSDKYHKVIPMKSCVKAVVIKTPIIGLIDEFFINHTKNNAKLITVPERYIQFSVNALLVFVSVGFVLNILLHIIWYILIDKTRNLHWSASISYILLIGVPLQLPLLLFVTLSNIIWKINCLRYKLDKRATLVSRTLSIESIPSSITSNSSNSNHIGPVDVAMDAMNVSISEYIRVHWNQIINQDDQFTKMIYSLGSLTSLCCVDKKGILADPIATPEKIFIYRKKHKHKSSSLMNLDRTVRKGNQDSINIMNISSNSNFDFLANPRLRSMTTEAKVTSLELSTDELKLCLSENISSLHSKFKNGQMMPIADMSCSLSSPVILDMTRSNTHPYLPSFDDNRWERYMSSLKPIGLNILLNNCNPDVTDRYINFTDNMSAINFKNLNKSQLTHRCICALATQIGFKPAASDRFTLESTFAVCRKNEKLSENNSTNVNHVYPLPVGSVFSTVVKDSVQNNYQLMTQGSADLLMSMCSDYWDGKDISPLTSYDRSRILDFYNRNIFSSYCIGFAYSPLFNKIKFNGLDDQFILQMFDVKVKGTDVMPKNSYVSKVYREAGLPKDILESNPRVKGVIESFSRIENHSLLKSEEMNSLLRHQIFLGMISLQADQVQSDVIDCIDRLEQACIRFVFFSTDNQLRSRVFAERLGMESGWNCHISLADPNDSNIKCGLNFRKNSSKVPKKLASEEIIKDAIYSKRVFYSEPILHSNTCDADQINHSITFNESDMLTVPKYDDDSITYVKQMELDNSKSSDGTNTSTSRSTEKSQTSFMENPRDHFPEDKSKLPCGIKSIRPHLEEVDNVPLQVSLFTDCNPEVDHEMMSIMREYGEIICCCGSGLTVKNVSLFSSNDCAVAFAPILHKQCWRQHEVKPFDASALSRKCQLNKSQKIVEGEPMLKKKFTVMDHKISFPELSPVNIACRLVALPCGLLLDRKTGFNLIAFITECHRLVKNTLSCIAFYCLSCANFVILKFFFNLIILIFELRYENSASQLKFGIFPQDAQVIYHLYFHTPVLALAIYSRLTMLGKPLKEPSRKRGRLLTYKQCHRFIIASLGRFLPSILLCILTLIWNLLILNQTRKINNTVNNATLNYSADTLRMIPVVISDFIFVQHNIYIVIISFAYINPEKPFWKFNYLKNYRYLIITSTLTCIQFIYLLISWLTSLRPNVYLEIVRCLYFPLILATSGVVVVLLFGWLATYWEVKELSMEHRLARLYFGTKLGMYSPV